VGQAIAVCGLPSRASVLIESVDRALPSQIGGGFVIAFRRRIAIEAMCVESSRDEPESPINKRTGPG
jgi:hypothetical protein